MGNIGPAPAVFRDHLYAIPEEFGIRLPPQIPDFLAGQEVFLPRAVNFLFKTGQNILPEDRRDRVFNLQRQEGLPDGKVPFFPEEGLGHDQLPKDRGRLSQSERRIEIQQGLFPGQIEVDTVAHLMG